MFFEKEDFNLIILVTGDRYEDVKANFNLPLECFETITIE